MERFNDLLRPGWLAVTISASPIKRWRRGKNRRQRVYVVKRGTHPRGNGFLTQDDIPV